MKNTLIAILLLSLPLFAFSQEQDCDVEDNLSQIAKGITYPNCNTPTKIEEFKLRKTDSLCKSCKEEFEIVHGSKITENKNRLQEEFFASAFNEYKKNLTHNLLTSVKMRSLYNTGVKFNRSVDKCKLKTAADFTNSCKSEAARKFLANPKLFEALSKEVSNEMAKFLTSEKSFAPDQTLLRRTEQKCSIPEKDILLFSASAYEESISPKIMEYLKKIDPKKYDSVAEIFAGDEFIEEFGDNAFNLKVSLANHPLFANYLNSSADFINFMNKIPSPSSKENLRSVLYSKSSGENFDKSMASSCEESFRALKDSICSDEFQNGKIFNDPLNNFGKLQISAKLPIEDQFASTEGLVDNNIKLLELCENKESKEKLNLSKINIQIGPSLDEDQRLQSFETFKGTKYNSEIGTLTTSLCEMTDRTCVPGTLTCSIYQKYKAFNNNGNQLSKPSNFANTEVNELLRSMLGDPTKIDPDTRRILIAEGILPKDDGKFNEKPEIPESQEQFFAKIPAQTINPGPGKTKPNSSTLASSGTNQARIAPSADTSYSNSSNNVNSAAPSGDMSDISDLVRGSTEDIKDIQDEIKRRLGQLPPDKPTTITDAKKIARDTFKTKGRKITPYQEQALAERMMQSEAPNSVGASENQNSVTNSPSVSNTETQLEKWKNGQKDAALMGMAGAQQVLAASGDGRAPASVDSKPKELTRVALNIAEDPKVKLSDIFANKIDQNDPETQLLKVLLRNKSPFLLQVKSMNFKIIFDDKNNFNVLLESGDRAEAERMRPQLELFLKRLKS